MATESFGGFELATESFGLGGEFATESLIFVGYALGVLGGRCIALGDLSFGGVTFATESFDFASGGFVLGGELGTEFFDIISGDFEMVGKNGTDSFRFASGFLGFGGFASGGFEFADLSSLGD